MSKQTLFALPLLFGLAACGRDVPVLDAAAISLPYTPQCHENVGEAPHFQDLFPQTREIMRRLDPRYAEMFEAIPVRFVLATSSEQVSHASAVYYAETPTEAPMIEIPSAPQAHCTLMRHFRESTAELPQANRPEYTEVARIYLGVLIANEYAHWRQDQAGSFRNYNAIPPNTDARCHLYSRMQHVSDIMSLDFIKRGLRYTSQRHASRTHEAFRIAGIMTFENDTFFARWYNAVMQGHTAAEAQAHLDMARQRYNANLSLPLSAFCEPADRLPWDETLIPDAARRATLAPLTYRLRSSVR